MTGLDVAQLSPNSPFVPPNGQTGSVRIRAPVERTSLPSLY